MCVDVQLSLTPSFSFSMSTFFKATFFPVCLCLALKTSLDHNEATDAINCHCQRHRKKKIDCPDKWTELQALDEIFVSTASSLAYNANR